MDPALKDQLIIVHSTLMIFIWLVLVPFAIGINMYSRKKNQSWGVKIHMIIMSTGVFLTFTTSSIIAFVSTKGQIKLKPHLIIGTLLAILCWFQIILGVTNHLVFKYRLRHNCLPAKRPWNNHLHIWIGRTLLILSFINIGLGLKMKRLGTEVFICYGIWLAIIVGIFSWLIYMKQEPLKH